jgi:hypothetical protein
MDHHTMQPRGPRQTGSTWAVLQVVALLLVVVGCTTFGTSSPLELVADALPSRSPVASSAGGSPASSPSPKPRATREPRPTPAPTPRLRPKPKPGPFRMDLYRKGDMVSEFTNYWCVPAAMQTMINIMERGGPDRTRATQLRLYRLARRLSTDKLDGKGAEPIGWARGLTRLGYGRFEVTAHRTRGEAIRTAARALRLTGRPVGIIAWRGAHSWVMTGFRSTADPGYTRSFKVTHVAIADVWYPRISSIWGASDPPATWVPFERLPRDFLPYKRPTVRYPGLDGKYLLVLPVDDESRREG